MTTLRRDHRIEGGLDTAEERQAEIKHLMRRLGNHSSRLRLAAVDQLKEFGPDAVAPLCEALCHEKSDVRTAAARALGEIGDVRATDELISLLKDPDFNTRAAAAAALGDLGQETAIPALMDAYHQCFVGRSARTQRLFGPLLVGTLVLMLVLLFWGTFTAKMGGMMGLSNVIIHIGIRYMAARQARSKVVGSITDSLVKIAERNPRPELHRLIPELRAVAQDRMQQAKATREASLLAADRIEALTAALHDLPVPATTVAQSIATLPQPAEASNAATAHIGLTAP